MFRRDVLPPFSGFNSKSSFNSQFTLFVASLLGILLNSEDGDIMLLRNVSKFLADNRVSQPSRQYSM
jgi:hypothetical protein